MRIIRKKPSGFSLIETLVAMFLIVLCVGFVFTIFINVQMGMRQSENRFRATEIGRSLLNDYAASLRHDFTYVPFSSTKLVSGTREGNDYAQTYNYDIGTQEITADEVKRIWVTITWNESRQTKQMILETIVVKTEE